MKIKTKALGHDSFECAENLSPDGNQAILFLHGFPDTLQVWSPYFDLLSSFHRIAPSQLVGPTVKIEDLLKRYLRLIESYPQHLKWSIVAHDLGGPIAYQLSQELNRKNIEHKLIMINTLCIRQFTARMNHYNQLFKSYYMLPFILSPNLTTKLLQKFWPRVKRATMKENQLNDESHFSIDGLKGIYLYRALLRYSKKTLLRSHTPLATQTLVIQSQEDPYINPSTEKELEKYYHQYQLVNFNGKHWFFTQDENPQKISNIINQFINNNNIQKMDL